MNATSYWHSCATHRDACDALVRKLLKARNEADVRRDRPAYWRLEALRQEARALLTEAVARAAEAP